MKRFLAAFNTTAARLSALYLILFSACAVILVFYMTGSAARFLVNETREAIAEEVQDLGGVYQRNGLRVLVRDIDRRSPSSRVFSTRRAGPKNRSSMLALATMSQ